MTVRLQFSFLYIFFIILVRSYAATAPIPVYGNEEAMEIMFSDHILASKDFNTYKVHSYGVQRSVALEVDIKYLDIINNVVTKYEHFSYQWGASIGTSPTVSSYFILAPVFHMQLLERYIYLYGKWVFGIGGIVTDNSGVPVIKLGYKVGGEISLELNICDLLTIYGGAAYYYGNLQFDNPQYQTSIKLDGCPMFLFGIKYLL